MCMLSVVCTYHLPYLKAWYYIRLLKYRDSNNKFSKSAVSIQITCSSTAARHSTSILQSCHSWHTSWSLEVESGECRSRSSEFCFTFSPILYRKSIVIDVEFSAEESVLGTHEPIKVIYKLYICMYVVIF